MELSKEEKKAIDYLKENSLVRIENEKIVAYGNSYKLILLNLVEKQQKEIKDWFEIADNILRVTNDYGNITIGDIPKYIENQQKELEEIKLDLEEMEKSNNHKLENWVHKYTLNSYISKAKIRKRIEEAKEINWHTPKLVIEYFEELLEEK